MNTRMSQLEAAGSSATRRVRYGALILCTLLSVASLGGCKHALDVENTRDILTEDLNNPEAIPAMITGVAGDYAVALAGAAHALAYSSHELQNVGSMTGYRELENGFADNQSFAGGAYNNAARAAWVADNAVKRFREMVTDADSRVETARAFIYAGFSYLLLADNFCRVTLDGSAPLTAQEVYTRAEKHFTDAITVATNARADAQKLQAIAGRARARLMLGNFQGAINDATQIPATFRFQALYSENSTRENNTIAINTVASIRKEGSAHPKLYNDARFIADPRTSFLNKGPTTVGADAIRQFVEQRKYTARGSGINISSWQEARLIEAEAEIKLGNPSRAVTLINQVRAAAGLQPYTGPSTAPEVTAQLMYERQAELWLEAKRFNDLRRTNDPFLANRAKCYPLSFEEEQSNPNVHP